MKTTETIDGLMREFVSRLITIICTQIEVPTTATFVRAAANRRTVAGKRRKGPIQLCPVPSCKNRAAPIFGMVCGDHRNVPKAKVRRYRILRREAAAAR